MNEMIILGEKFANVLMHFSSEVLGLFLLEFRTTHVDMITEMLLNQPFMLF